MGLLHTAIFYFAIGLGVSAAAFLRADRRSRPERLFQVVTAALFWPIYVPLLLERPTATPTAVDGDRPEADALSASIAQVERELDEALSGLDGWAEDVLDRQRNGVSELTASWHASAARIRELDRLLRQAQSNPSAEQFGIDPELQSQRLETSEAARRKNLERLQAVRRQSYRDLMGTLAWVRELVTMIHLARFTGAPAARAEEFVAQIAAAVEGLSEAASWRYESDEVIDAERADAREDPMSASRPISRPVARP